MTAKRVQDNCEVYVWGSNSSHQLAEDVQEKIAIPKLAKNLTNIEQVYKSFSKFGQQIVRIKINVPEDEVMKSLKSYELTVQSLLLLLQCIRLFNFKYTFFYLRQKLGSIAHSLSTTMALLALVVKVATGG